MTHADGVSIIFMLVVLGLGICWFVWNDDDKKTHKARLEFLHENCVLIDLGYEILNNGKSTFKCPNGKEYKEKEE